jgi:hypothetical protein
MNRKGVRIGPEPLFVFARIMHIAAGAVALWGVAHAVPTRQVLAGFEPINSAKPRVLL